MIKYFFFLLTLFQKKDPVHFDFSIKHIEDNSYELHFQPVIDKGWHIYSLVQPKEAIAIPTKFVFTKNPLIVVTGKLKDFGELEFVLPLKTKFTVKTSISGNITYQACTNTMCLPPKTISFSIPVQ